MDFIIHHSDAEITESFWVGSELMVLPENAYSLYTDKHI
jgi:hypothetical protein